MRDFKFKIIKINAIKLNWYL